METEISNVYGACQLIFIDRLKRVSIFIVYTYKSRSGMPSPQSDFSRILSMPIAGEYRFSLPSGR